MQDKQLQILREFAAKIRESYPKAQVWAYGSYVRGTATAESDLDICVIIPHLQPDDRINISDTAWKIGFVHDLHLSTIVISQNNFEQGSVSVSPLLDTVKSEGVAV